MVYYRRFGNLDCMARPPLIDDDRLLELLTSVFRAKGYEGANIGDLAEASGLKRASLYHRYPGGKEEIAEATLIKVGEQFSWILEPMRVDPDTQRGISETAQRLSEFYGAGALACVLDTMTTEGTPPKVLERARDLAKAWIDVMVDASVRAGRSAEDARRAANEVFLRVEGALVLSRATGETHPFESVVALMPTLLMPPQGALT